MVVVADSSDEHHRQESSRKSSAHGLQNRAPLTNDNHRSQEDPFEFTLMNVTMVDLGTRFLCLFVIGEGDFHCVSTCLHNQRIMGPPVQINGRSELAKRKVSRVSDWCTPTRDEGMEKPHRESR